MNFSFLVNMMHNHLLQLLLTLRCTSAGTIPFGLLDYRSIGLTPLKSRRALTLIEVLIALTMTLIVLGAMMTAFQVVSKRMQAGRSMMELANRVRAVESTLRSDLMGLTVEARPYMTSTPPGFLQIIEGPRRDGFAAATNVAFGVVGDIDDVLSMTVQSPTLFRGRLELPTAAPPIKVTIESPFAEVVWFLTGYNNLLPSFSEAVTLCRVEKLIIPPNMTGTFPNYPILAENLNWAQVRSFYQTNDISARIIPTGVNQFRLEANTLDDLAIRKNRFGHLPAFCIDVPGPVSAPTVNLGLVTQGFPNQLHYNLLMQFTTVNPISPLLEFTNDRHVVLTDVMAFDVKVYSPNTVVNQDPSGNVILEPHDIGFLSGGPYGPFGGFVDLGDAIGAAGTWFSGPPIALSGLNGAVSTWPGGGNETTFDTWTPFYESDGINQDFALGGWRERLDTFVNGLDDNGINGVDDNSERETMPPYLHPVRGIQIKIRVADKLTKQVHQTNIEYSFVPE